MITLEGSSLRFRFPEVHDHAKTEIHFQRTLRIPDDGKHYPLPPGSAAFLSNTWRTTAGEFPRTGASAAA